MNTLFLVAPNSPAIVKALAEEGHDVRVQSAERLSDIEDRLQQVRALAIFPHLLDQNALDHMPQLEWLQLLTAGADMLNGLDLKRITVSTMAGIQGPQMSELAFFYMLCFARDAHGIFARQIGRDWRPAPQTVLAGSHVVIVGVGRIAEALARRCKAFEMRVTGVSQTPRQHLDFDSIVARRDLLAVASAADFLIVLATGDRANRHLVSRDVMAAMRPTSVLINLGRGSVVDEDALIDALSNGGIAAAGLDVFACEPLPQDNPLWRLNNVIVTPHVGGWGNRIAQQMAPLLKDNIARWFGSPRRPLRNQL